MTRSRITFEDYARGRELKRRRDVLRLNQQDVATALNISYQQYGKFERGESRLSATQLEKILAFFDYVEKNGKGFGEAEQEVIRPPVTRASLQKSLDRMYELISEMREIVTLWQRHLDEKW